jgi:hypothetical protein
LSHSQLTHLFTSPITVLPKPGPGLAYVIISSVYQLNYGGVNSFVSTDSGPGLYYGVANDNQTYADGANGQSVFSVTQDQILQAPTLMTNAGNHFGINLTADINNAAIILANINANMTAGTGNTGRLAVLYYVMPVS